MTDTSTQNDVVDTPAETPAEPAQETQETPQEPKPNGYQGDHFVEFTPEQQKRINDLSKKAGKAEREAAQLRDIAKQQFEIIEQIRRDQGTIVSHLQQGDFAKAEGLLKEQRLQAYNRGDLAAVDDINDKLTDLKFQRLKAEIPKPQPQPQQRGQSGEDIVTRAVNQGAITHQDADVYRAWATETDEYGNLKRPWVNEGDHRNTAAAIEGQAVFNNPSYANKSFADKLKEIDRRMGVQNKQAATNVLGSNLTRQQKNNTIELTDYQKRVAVKTRFAGPGKSDQDHIEAWKAQIAREKGVRK